MEKLEINIPFSGFYCSTHDDSITHAIEQHFDYDGDGEPDIPDDIEFSDIFCDMDFDPVYNRYCKEFVDFINQETDLASLEYKDMESPCEYNFTTDRIFAEISKEDVLKMFKEIDKGTLDSTIRERFTSRSGFISFYENRLDAWLEEKPDVLEWDHNELGTLLSAYIDQECTCMPYNDIDYAAIEYIRVDEWIYEFLPDKWQQIGNEIYEAQQRKENQLTLKGV